jgi:hypothetical protein
MTLAGFGMLSGGRDVRATGIFRGRRLDGHSGDAIGHASHLELKSGGGETATADVTTEPNTAELAS